MCSQISTLQDMDRHTDRSAITRQGHRSTNNRQQTGQATHASNAHTGPHAHTRPHAAQHRPPLTPTPAIRHPCLTGLLKGCDT